MPLNKETKQDQIDTKLSYWIIILAEPNLAQNKKNGVPSENQNYNIMKLASKSWKVPNLCYWVIYLYIKENIT